MGDINGGYHSAKYAYQGEIKETKVISKVLMEFLTIDKLYLVWMHSKKKKKRFIKDLDNSVYKKFSTKLGLC